MNRWLLDNTLWLLILACIMSMWFLIKLFSVRDIFESFIWIISSKRKKIRKEHRDWLAVQDF